MWLDVAWLPHQNRLNLHGRSHRAGERQCHQLSHARHARVARSPHTAKRGCIGHGAEHHVSRQRRLQQLGFVGASCHDVVDFERYSDSEEQRECDDVGGIELRTK